MVVPKLSLLSVSLGSSLPHRGSRDSRPGGCICLLCSKLQLTSKLSLYYLMVYVGLDLGTVHQGIKWTVFSARGLTGEDLSKYIHVIFLWLYD